MRKSTILGALYYGGERGEEREGGGAGFFSSAMTTSGQGGPTDESACLDYCCRARGWRWSKKWPLIVHVLQDTLKDSVQLHLRMRTSQAREVRSCSSLVRNYSIIGCRPVRPPKQQLAEEAGKAAGDGVKVRTQMQNRFGLVLPFQLSHTTQDMTMGMPTSVWQCRHTSTCQISRGYSITEYALSQCRGWGMLRLWPRPVFTKYLRPAGKATGGD